MIQEVVSAVIQRFGPGALTPSEQSDIIQAVKPLLLRIVNFTLIMCGMQLTAECTREIEASADGCYQFAFTTADLVDSDLRVCAYCIRPVNHAKATAFWLISFRSSTCPS